MNADDAWNYALAHYAQPGAAEELLRRQDDEGLDVVLHLFFLWVREECGIALGPDRLAEAAALAGPWRVQVVQPLRAARRASKTLHMPDPQRDALRRQIQQAELEAERTELRLLCGWLARVTASPSRP